ncbi:MAG: NAD(P)-dependent oxidoreductase [Smithella sp.]|jgi:nucleoside-diphosphate-sugar epimerase
MVSHEKRVGVIGATSLIGEYLLPLLVDKGYEVVAFSRKEQHVKSSAEHIEWQLLAGLESVEISKREKQINYWISLAPIKALPEYFSLLLNYGAKYVVAVSSTSRFTKEESPDAAETKQARNLAENEDCLIAWAGKEKLTFTILRPTLVYGLGRDTNVSVIASFIRRFSFFCVFGKARGLRQPVHAQDVASACAEALSAEAAINQCYNISGGEIISYREMVNRIFSALEKKPRFVKFPLWLFRLAVFVLRIVPRYRQWSAAMAQRMNKDMVFDHTAASRDLNFSPRKFRLTRADLPGN